MSVVRTRGCHVVARIVFPVWLVASLAACTAGSPSGSPPGYRDGGPSDPCASPNEGCACEPGTGAIECYPGAVTVGGEKLCQKGTRYCRDGTWSACEAITTFQLMGLKYQSQALVTGPTECDPCNPSCYETSDRPSDGDLDDDNSDEVVYDPGQGGIVLDESGMTRRRGNDPATCGDTLVEGLEECDDGNDVSGDGCSNLCLRETGFACSTPGNACHLTTCGDGVAEGDEQCDDANLNIGDGCTPFCKVEPNCSGGTCTPICGDGQVFPGEPCDDGNTIDGDGCSSTCQFEPGFSCTLVDDDPPDYVDLPTVFRDVRRSHPDFQGWCCGNDLGMVESRWGPDRKPVPIISSGNPSLSTAANFYEWYNDSANSITIVQPLRVQRQPDGTYVFDDSSFFPLDFQGWYPLGEPHYSGSGSHNFHFTSEVRFWFKYRRGQQLTFRGDDDVWVFINSHLVVDIGGVHPPRQGSVTLDASTESGYGLTEGGLYEAAVFQAERHTTQSNYRLQLGGFFFGRTECASICGDGIVTRDEMCDDGINDGRTGGCMPGCEQWAPTYEAEGSYWRDYDASICGSDEVRPDWGALDWTAVVPQDTAIEFELRTAGSSSDLDSATPVTIGVPPTGPPVDIGRLLVAAGEENMLPFLRVTAKLFSAPEGAASPVLEEFNLSFDCVVTPRDDDPTGYSCVGSPPVCTTPCSGGPTPESSQLACTDGADNDCDLDVDCADADCDGIGCGVGGKICAGGSCTCPGGGLEDTAALCTDGTDNDCDGFSDCQDTDCTGRACGANGMVCQSGSCVCSWGSTEASAATCQDGVDNDCDGDIDCVDADCDGMVCATNGRVCSEGICACAGGAEDSDVLCSDGTDNDCDGDIDCSDADCGGRSCGPYGQTCVAGACSCPSGGSENAPGLCADGMDNDCDGDIDCRDLDCDGLSCGGMGEVCSGGVCACPGGATEDDLMLCGDGVDNDCDGLVDCDDPDCSGYCGKLETVVANVGGAPSTVNLANTYTSPIVACSVQYDANTDPVVARVSNVTSTSFDLRLQNPSNNAVATDSVSCLVVEEGVWTFDGWKVEAQRYTSTLTDRKGSWNGQAQTYGQTYTNPVVVGQVMSENDSDWSVFWSRGSSDTDPPDSATLYTGKHVGEDSDTTRADEVVGFIVFEAGYGTINGVAFEAGVGADDVRGVGNSPPDTYTFMNAFSATPQVKVVSSAGMDGGDGGWPQVHGSPGATPATLDLSFDEDQTGDGERGHTTEQVAYVVFEQAITLSSCPGGGTETTVMQCSDGTDNDCDGLVDCDDPDCTGQCPRLESVVSSVGGSAATVSLSNTYASPVVACSVHYDNNADPVVPRVSNVTGTGFDVRLQNPAGNSVVNDSVTCLVVEEGAWTFDGWRVEAQRYLSTVTDENGSWAGEPQSYSHTYSNPVVLGQVMSENDADWSVFWSSGSSVGDPPDASDLVTGKTVAEDSDTTRADEVLGFIVFESGRGFIGGVAFEAALGPDDVRGVTDSPPYSYSFSSPFSVTPQVAVVTQAGMDGNNGGWAQLHGNTGVTSSTLYLSIDEDQIGDSERNHTDEQVSYVAFESPIVY